LAFPYTVINSLFSHNKAIGVGANPAHSGTPGGGAAARSTTMATLSAQLCGSNLNNNTAKEGGGAIFFVSNDLAGTLQITNSSLTAILATVSRRGAIRASSTWEAAVRRFQVRRLQ